MEADYTTRSIDDIRTVAAQVVEAASDLRAYELLGQWLDPEDVSGSGDTRYDFYRAKLAAQPMAGYGPIELLGNSTIQKDSIDAVDVEDHTNVVLSDLGHEFDYILPLFDRYTVGDSSAYAAADSACEAAANTHCSDVGFLGDVGDLTEEQLSSFTGSFDVAAEIETSITKDSGAGLGSWTGAFADELSDKVVDHIGNVSANHVHLLRGIQGATRMHWALVGSTRRSVYSIGVETKKGLRRSLGVLQDEADTSSEWAAVLPVVGAVLAIAGVVVTAATGGAAAPLAISILSTIVTTASAGVGLDNAMEVKESEAEGSTVDELITWMHGKLSELDEVIASEEENLLSAIEDLSRDVTGLASGATLKDWEAFRPAAADYSTSEDETVYGSNGDKYSEFHHEFG